MTKTNNKLLLITTFRTKDLDRYSRCIQSWSNQPQVDVAALIEEDELASNDERTKELRKQITRIITYKNNETHPDASGAKKSPNLSAVFDAIALSEGYEYYAYANADIELAAASSDFNIVKAIADIIPAKGIAFAQRRDYSQSQSDYKTYNRGYDFFALHHSTIKTAKLSPSAGNLQIGQVGWDYALPLSFPKKLVTLTDSLPLYHQIHPTGNSANWDSSIVSLLSEIDHSWLEKRFDHRIAINSSLLISRLLPKSGGVQQQQKSASSPIYYIASRAAFYLAIRHILFGDLRTSRNCVAVKQRASDSD